jgi:hypothetical protein
MARVVLRVAQVVGVLVLAGIAVSVVVGLVHWLLGVALLVAVPVGAWWLYRRVSGRHPGSVAGPGTPAAVAGRPGQRDTLEGRAVLDASGRCGWCGSTTLHRDEFGFPVTPLTFHRAEIDAQR